jgi:hypothetical protein
MEADLLDGIASAVQLRDTASWAVPTEGSDAKSNGAGTVGLDSPPTGNDKEVGSGTPD